MKQIFTNAAEAMKVAFELSKLLRRPVWRHMGVNKHGATVWVVSLDSDPHNALQELTA
jgi:hypothetical protein